MQHAELTLPGLPSSVPVARRFVDATLDAWGREDLQWPAALCVSELAANCTLHAKTAFTVRLLLETGDRLRLSVTDGSRRLPATRRHDAEATTGRGLQLVQELSSTWGVDQTESGKTVWLLLDHRAGAGGSDEVDRPRAGEVDEVEALLAAFGDDSPSPTAGARWAVAA